MNPVVVPASTITTLAAGALTVIIVWLAKEFASVVVPAEVAGAFTTLAAVLASHFTNDAPKKLIDAPPIDPSVSVKQ